MTSDDTRPVITHIAEGTVGGLARQLELVAEAMPSCGFNLNFIVSCERDPEFIKDIDAFTEMGIYVDIIPMVRKPSPSRDWECYKQIKELLIEDPPDLIHTHCSKAGILGRRAAASLGIPAVHTPHVFPFEWEKSPLMRILYRKLESVASRWCERVIVLSERQRQFTVGQNIMPQEKLVVIPNGVSTQTYHPPSANERNLARERFGLSEDAPVIGVAARLEPQKGMGNFLRAAKLIHNKIPNVRILIAGSGSLIDECRHRVSQLGLEETIFFCGNISHMQQFYHAIDLFMLASLWEGLPYVILEAMACELPVVFTESFGHTELVTNGKTGMTARIEDEAGLAHAAIKVLTEPILARQLGLAAGEAVRERFTIEHWADDLAACYWDVLGW